MDWFQKKFSTLKNCIQPVGFHTTVDAARKIYFSYNLKT